MAFYIFQNFLSASTYFACRRGVGLERIKRGERKKGNPLNDPDRKGSSAAAADDDDDMPEIMSRRALLVWRLRVLSFKMGICPEAT